MPKNLENACCVFDITIHKGHTKCETWDDFAMYSVNILETLPKYCKKFTFQYELGNETEKYHYQGRISLGLKSRTPHKVITEFGFNWSPTSTENRDNDFYVMKEETRINGPWTDKDKKKYIPIQYYGKEKNLLPFQQYIWDNSHGYKDDRLCNIIFDQDGNIGKSTIAHLCRLHKNGLVVPPINDGERLMYTCHNMMEAKNPSHQSIPVFFDLPRAMNKERLNGIFTTIEVLKTGYLFDTRNKYKDFDVDSPNIWVFTNEVPESINWLSKDRWRFWKVTKDKGIELIPLYEIFTDDFKADKSCNNKSSGSAQLAQILMSDDEGDDDWTYKTHPDFI